MTLPRRIGVLGGTFDPIHLGHVDAADAARTACSLDMVLLVPARQPPHRHTEPRASGHDRFAMAALVADGLDDVVACDIELQADGPSYTAVTLERLTARGIAPARLFFITGADAFAEIATWYDYPAVLDRGHFVVISRPGYPADTLRDRLPDLRSRMRGPGDAPRAGADTVAIWLVDAVTRDVSSSAIRRRLAESGSIDDLVPTAVARYISTHSLYTARPGRSLA